MRWICSFLFLTSISSSAFASDFHWKLKIGLNSESKSLSEDQLKTKVGEWSCTVGKVSKGPMKGRESREIRCEVSPDHAVSFSAACSE